MSSWMNLDATFEGDGRVFLGEDNVKRDLPTGSEGGPSVYGKWEHDQDEIAAMTEEERALVAEPYRVTWHVSGGLRDMRDLDSFAVMAWFVGLAQWSMSAHIEFEVQGGARYEYKWDGCALHRVRGLLDL